MNLVVCCKAVPKPRRLVVKGKSASDLWQLAPVNGRVFDVAQAVAKGYKAKLTVVCAGDPSIDEASLRKDLLSRGADELCLVVEDGLSEADRNARVQVLAKAIKGLDADMVLCGEGSSGANSSVTAVALAGELGLKAVTDIEKIDLTDGKLVLTRDGDDEVQKLEATLPLLVAVSHPDDEKAAAASAPSDASAGDASAPVSPFAMPEPARKKEMLTGDSIDDIAKQLVSKLKTDGVL